MYGDFFVVDDYDNTYGCYNTFDEAARAIDELYEDPFFCGNILHIEM